MPSPSFLDSQRSNDLTPVCDFVCGHLAWCYITRACVQTIVRRLTLDQMSIPTLNPFIEQGQEGSQPQPATASQLRESPFPAPAAVTGDLVLPLVNVSRTLQYAVAGCAT